MTTTLELPAQAADTLGETITLTVPADQVANVERLAPALVYGPTFRRDVLLGLRRASAAAVDHPDVARDTIASLVARYG